MKIPKKTKKYCPSCKVHVEVKVKQQKTKPRPKTKKGALKWGIRQYAKVAAGHGGSRRPAPRPVKQSKKVGIVYACGTCGKQFQKQNPQKAKKAQVV